jgi:hypothetical protein
MACRQNRFHSLGIREVGTSVVGGGDPLFKIVRARSGDLKSTSICNNGTLDFLNVMDHGIDDEALVDM